MNTLYSIVIPAYNEEKWLPKTLSALAGAMAEIEKPGQVIVVDNNSSDHTRQIALERGAEVVFEPINQISRARNTGARKAGGEHLIFLDADTTPSQRLLEAALDNLDSGTCCGGGALVTSRDKNQFLGRQAMRVWNRIALTFSLAAGCFIYCSRKGFEDIGGFSEKVYAGEEIWFSRSMQAWGKTKGMSFKIIDDPYVVTSLRKVRWYTPLQLSLLVLIALCPLALRSRTLCAFWYQRPKDS